MKVLFYSDYCKHCTKLLNHKQNDADFQHVKKICVDTAKDLPPQITKVPTLVASDLLTPITGKDVFSYFNCLEMFDQKTNNVTYWKNKAIKRPKVDVFMPGKEQQMQYQPVDKINSNKNNITIDKLKKDRL